MKLSFVQHDGLHVGYFKLTKTVFRNDCADWRGVFSVSQRVGCATCGNPACSLQAGPSPT